MMFDRIRVYDARRFHDVDLPDWYHEANRLSETENVDWHRAFERVLDCEYTLLTEEGQLGAGLEIRYWPSETNGILVLIETALAIVEQVVTLNPTDWLPFLTEYLAPLMTSSAQFASAPTMARIGNALIARARHGDGSHMDRETGESRIDLDMDRDRRRVARVRQAMAQGGKGSGA